MTSENDNPEDADGKKPSENTSPNDSARPQARSAGKTVRRSGKSQTRNTGRKTAPADEAGVALPLPDASAPEELPVPVETSEVAQESGVKNKRRAPKQVAANKKSDSAKNEKPKKTARKPQKADAEKKPETGQEIDEDLREKAEIVLAGLEAEVEKAREELVPKRKNRRGKRGGRGRSHKNAATTVAKYLPAIIGEIIFSPLEEVARALLKAEPAPKAASRKKTGKKAEESCKKRMFISVLAGEQVEVGLAEEGVLLEYYLDMLHQSKIKGNIYKGVIHNIDSNLQAAFVNYGVGKNGFLQIDEVHPEYWQTPQEPPQGKKFPPIQKVLKPGQEILVQVVKEPTGNKGAFLTTWLSLAGRFLVLTPGQEQIGVSRKVTDQEERSRLRDLMNGIDPGNGLGVIVRTVGEGATKTTLRTDLQYLKRLWRDIRKKATELSAPALIHQEPGLSERSVRDYLTEDVCEIWVDNEAEAKNVREMAALLFPRKKELVRLYTDQRQSIWDHFNLGLQIEQIYAREVYLPSGGRLVFDQTEALMAIDINSGRISGKGNFEAMAFKTNMEAAEAIARQLRLRDIGGQVVIDFIEMRDKKHVLEVEKCLRQCMKSDRARHDFARMSSFGLLELVRQRMGSSALSISIEPCPACGGTGVRRNMEWQALHELAELREKLPSVSGSKFVFDVPRELGLYLLNYKREVLTELERDFGKSLEVRIQF